MLHMTVVDANNIVEICGQWKQKCTYEHTING